MDDVMAAAEAARLFLGAQRALEAPALATSATVAELVTALGFVQLDTINVVARAHDLILASRLDGYEPQMLTVLLERDRALFEGWTHDASVIPTAWYHAWKPRFRRDAARIRSHPWWQNLLGPDYERICAHVLERIEAEGPLRSVDFEHPEKRGPWWGWKPQKAALDYLWRTGELLVTRREHFHKVYDLARRVLPDVIDAPEPEPAELIEWACASAAERLVVFTSRELARFWDAVTVEDAASWCRSAAAAERLVPVTIEPADGSAAQRAWAVSSWRARLEDAEVVPDRMRLLAPFDPILRDRARCLRRFGFDYRFEAFTPAAKRAYGYYAMPILEGARLVGRLDPKLHRERRRLDVRGLWWEPGVRPTKRRLSHLRRVVERLAAHLGADAVDWNRPEG